MKKIVLAFDSFKGSVGSFEIAKAAEKAIQEELPDCRKCLAKRRFLNR